MSSEILLELYREGRVRYTAGLEAVLRLPGETASDFRTRINTPPEREESFADIMSSLLSGGSFQATPAEVLEMEDWEIAPGCIAEEVGPTNKEEIIAFSKPALSTNSGVKVCEDVYFRVETIPRGKGRILGRMEHHMRMVSLTGGKLRVKLARVPEFIIGTDGMFKIPPDVNAVVYNIASNDVVLHITTLVP